MEEELELLISSTIGSVMEGYDFDDKEIKLNAPFMKFTMKNNDSFILSKKFIMRKYNND